MKEEEAALWALEAALAAAKAATAAALLPVELDRSMLAGPPRSGGGERGESAMTCWAYLQPVQQIKFEVREVRALLIISNGKGPA